MRFDLAFIRRECGEHGIEMPDRDYMDTLPLARTFLPGLAHHTLSDLADYFGISTQGAHRALADCYMTYRVYEKLAPLIKAGSPEIVKCARCGRKMVRRKGRFGAFWGCSGYPQCTYTKST